MGYLHQEAKAHLRSRLPCNQCRSLLNQPFPTKLSFLTRQREETIHRSQLLLFTLIHSCFCSPEVRPWFSCHFLAQGVSIFAFHRPATGSRVTWWDQGTWYLGVSPHRLTFLPSFKVSRGLVALYGSRRPHFPGLPGMREGTPGCRTFGAKIGKVPSKQGQVARPTTYHRGPQKTFI